MEEAAGPAADDAIIIDNDSEKEIVSTEKSPRRRRSLPLRGLTLVKYNGRV